MKKKRRRANTVKPAKKERPEPPDHAEIRTLYGAHSAMQGEEPEEFKQRAMYWCVVHNQEVHIDVLGRWTDVIEECEISVGGPDHLWWKDI